jgi:hypothetical protein
LSITYASDPPPFDGRREGDDDDCVGAARARDERVAARTVEVRAPKDAVAADANELRAIVSAVLRDHARAVFELERAARRHGGAGLACAEGAGPHVAELGQLLRREREHPGDERAKQLCARDGALLDPAEGVAVSRGHLGRELFEVLASQLWRERGERERRAVEQRGAGGLVLHDAHVVQGDLGPLAVARDDVGEVARAARAARDTELPVAGGGVGGRAEEPLDVVLGLARPEAFSAAITALAHAGAPVS